MKKFNFPVEKVRRFLEPGPVLLVSSAYRGERDIMTMGWHLVMEFSPSLIGCYIWDQNHSFDLIRKSKECVLNLPTIKMAKTVVRIGNTTGAEIDKFDEFNLHAVKGAKVSAPMIDECFANFECRLHDAKLIKKYSLFIFEVVKAHVPRTPKNPKTIHYQGDGQFMVSGGQLNLRKLFKPSML